jgi:hypothetical protein
LIVRGTVPEIDALPLTITGEGGEPESPLRSGATVFPQVGGGFPVQLEDSRRVA